MQEWRDGGSGADCMVPDEENIFLVLYRLLDFQQLSKAFLFSTSDIPVYNRRSEEFLGRCGDIWSIFTDRIFVLKRLLYFLKYWKQSHIWIYDFRNSCFPGSSHRHRHPGRGNHEAQEADQQNLCQAHRATAGNHRQVVSTLMSRFYFIIRVQCV